MLTLLLLLLQSRIRELERKMELQNVTHDELLLELSALRRQQQQQQQQCNNPQQQQQQHLSSTQALLAAYDIDSRASSPGNPS